MKENFRIMTCPRIGGKLFYQVIRNGDNLVMDEGLTFKEAMRFKSELERVVAQRSR